MSRWASMTAEQRAAHSARSLAWRRAHPDKARAIQRRSDRKNPQRVRASCLRWRTANPEKDRERKARWHEANPHKQREYHERRYSADPEKERARVRAWNKANPDKVNAKTARRRAALRAIPLTPHEQAEVIAIYAKARALTELIGEPYHVDHIKPISKGGLHHPSNLQVLRGIDNLRKGNRT